MEGFYQGSCECGASSYQTDRPEQARIRKFNEGLSADAECKRKSQRNKAVTESVSCHLNDARKGLEGLLNLW